MTLMNLNRFVRNLPLYVRDAKRSMHGVEIYAADRPAALDEGSSRCDEGGVKSPFACRKR